MIYPIYDIENQELFIVDTEIDDTLFASGQVEPFTFFNVLTALTNQANEQYNAGYDEALQDVIDIAEEAESKDELVKMIEDMMEDEDD